LSGLPEILTSYFLVVESQGNTSKDTVLFDLMNFHSTVSKAFCQNGLPIPIEEKQFISILE